VIGPDFLFEFKIKRLNSKASRFDRLRPKNSKKSKKINFVPHPPINII
jgi:hypothetical protein